MMPKHQNRQQNIVRKYLRRNDMKYKVTLNGKTYEVEVVEDKAILVDEYEALAPSKQAEPAAPAASPAPAAAPAPAASASSASADAVTAPIAGVVLGVKAPVGTAVKAGDVVLIIEAMKMENEIVAPKAGKVTAVYVEKGNTVENGSPLFEIS